MIWNFRRAASALALMLALGMGLWAQAQQPEGFDLERIQRATVFIMQARSVGDNLFVTCVGSGTLVSRGGLILTNAHNTLSSENCPGDTLIVALNVRTDVPPVQRFQAQIVQADPGLDLALLRITRYSDGRLVEPNSLALPFVELADSETVQLDDTLYVVGFPGLGDDAVAVERGTVTSFAAEPSGGDKSWIKTSAVIPGVMSGGGAYNSRGLLVGVPTTAPITALSPEATCVTLQDTNRDGLVNRNDVCIPVGGVINSMRPSNFARPLLRAASLGLTLEAVTSFPTPEVQDGEPRFSRLFFSPSVNEAGMPTSVIRSLPTGSTSLYLFFDYANMTPETVYELRVTINGIASSNFSLSPVRWSGGRSGTWYVGSSGQPWPNGLYDFTLLINGVSTESARLLVGGAPETVPTFSDVIFGLLDLNGNPLGDGYVLPTGSIVNALFLYRSMVDGQRWSAIWYYENTEIPGSRLPDGSTWADGASGTKTISIQDANGLLPGNYRLDLYIEDRLAATASFTLAGAQDGVVARIFGRAHFTTASSEEEARTAAPITTFSAGTESIFALFDWEQIAPSTLWRMRWSVDGDVFYDQVMPWNGPTDGENFLMRLFAPDGVPDGTYRLDLFINRLQFESIEARVGIGQLPIDVFAQADGIQMRGRIIDASTGRGIPGVTFVLVSEDYSAADFTRDWNMEQVYAYAITDRNGRFQIDRPLQAEAPYSVVVFAEGYLPLTADGVEVTPEDNPVELNLELIRG